MLQATHNHSTNDYDDINGAYSSPLVVEKKKVKKHDPLLFENVEIDNKRKSKSLHSRTGSEVDYTELVTKPPKVDEDYDAYNSDLVSLNGPSTGSLRQTSASQF